MGVTGNVAVVHSSRVGEDRSALMSIFPDRFNLEKHDGSSVLTWSQKQLMLMIIPSDSSELTHTTLVLEEALINQASQRAMQCGLVVSKQIIMGYSSVKVILPGGASLVAGPLQLWMDESARSTLMTQLLSPATNRSHVASELPVLSDPNRTTNGNGTSLGRSDANTNIASFNRLHPTIRVEVLSSRGSFDPLKLNSETAVPVETELFVGKLLLIMRPNKPEDDPFWNDRIFSKKKRRCVMQLQGRLKYTPRGELFAGLEISEQMNLGLIASGFCNLLLKMVQKFNPNLDHSFGTNEIKPHICFPASTFFERVVVTPPGDEPPPLDGVEFDEPPESIKSRKAYRTKIDWNDRCTYSMSFHSMYIDFPTWKVVNLPVRDMNLHTFWGDSPASVVFYEHTGPSREQSTDLNKYIMAVKMEHLGERRVEEFDDRTSLAESTSVVEFDVSSEEDPEILRTVDEGVDSDLFFDTLQSHPSVQEVLNESVAASSLARSSTMLRIIDNHCPFFLDIFSRTRKGRYSTVYAFSGEKRPLFRTWDTCMEYFGDRTEHEKMARFSKRLSPREKCRRILGLKYADTVLGKLSPKSLVQFQELVTRHDANFLSTETEPYIDKSQVKKSGIIARALSDRHWREEWGAITYDKLVFYHIDRSKPNFRMSLSSIVKVESLSGEDLSFEGYYFYLSIESFGRTTYLMFASKDNRDDWVSLIQEQLTGRRRSLRESNSFTNHLIEVDEPMIEFLHKSTMWDCNKRRVLNCRRYFFLTEEEQPDPLKLVKTALELVTSLQPKGPNDRDLEEFLDCAASLKKVDVNYLAEAERLAFFLNLYHTMIMHAFIVLAPPNNGSQWITYFTTIAYQCSDDIFSLAELEHNIIRACMSYPSQFLSRFLLPKSTYSFALTTSDFRINFALNCGSRSIPSGTVPLYQPDLLEEQLEKASKLFLNGTVIAKNSRISDVVVSLPKVCQWFNEDFGDGTNGAILKCIEPYLSEDTRNMIKSLWNETRNCHELNIWNFKYLPYSFECRFLNLEEEK